MEIKGEPFYRKDKQLERLKIREPRRIYYDDHTIT